MGSVPGKQDCKPGCRSSQGPPTFFLLAGIGILPGWYGMENGQKPEMEKKKWKAKWKTAPSWTGAKMAKKWPKNGKIMENSWGQNYYITFVQQCAKCKRRGSEKSAFLAIFWGF